MNRSAKATIGPIAVPIGIDRQPDRHLPRTLRIGSPSNPPGNAPRNATWRESARRVSAYRIPGFGARGGLWRAWAHHPGLSRTWAHHPGLSRTVPCAPSRNEPNRPVRIIREPRRRIVSEPDGFREAPGSGTWRGRNDCAGSWAHIPNEPNRSRAGSSGKAIGQARRIILRIPETTNPIARHRRIPKTRIRQSPGLRLRG